VKPPPLSEEDLEPDNIDSIRSEDSVEFPSPNQPKIELPKPEPPKIVLPKLEPPKIELPSITPKIVLPEPTQPPKPAIAPPKVEISPSTSPRKPEPPVPTPIPAPVPKVETPSLFCHNCNKKLIGKFMQITLADGSPRAYHFEHCVCFNCQKLLQGQSIVERNGELYCDTCHDMKFNPHCATCGLAISGGAAMIKAMDKSYHSQCFLCSKCNNRIGTPQFYIVEGKPICKDCGTSL